MVSTCRLGYGGEDRVEYAGECRAGYCRVGQRVSARRLGLYRMAKVQ